MGITRPKGMPNMPGGYKWNKTVESIGLIEYLKIYQIMKR